jgi:deoxycytidine triphosphate deaminase
MTIMTDGEILQAIMAGEIEISDFDEERLQGCSYDCLLGDHSYYNDKRDNMRESHMRGVTLDPYDFLLCHTQEFIRVSSSITFTVHTTSTARRHGLDVCASAGWGDPGYCNRVTLELWTNRDISIPRRAIVCQIAFHRLSRPVLCPYKGSYGSYASIAEAAASWKPEHMLPKPIKAGGV